MRFALLLAALLLSACAPKTGDGLVDKVMFRTAPNGDCLVVGATRVFLRPEDPENMMPPGWLTPDVFNDPLIADAARRIAIPYDAGEADATLEEIDFYGEGSSETCLYSVDRPAVSGDYAFATYSHFHGGFGVYVFERSVLGWIEKEHHQLGWF